MNGNASGAAPAPTGMDQEEPGSQDNLLTINPNDFGGVAKDWEDGEQYEATVMLEQVTPGQFKVVDFKPTGGSAAAEPPAKEGLEQPAPEESANVGEGDAYPNPAVARLMRGPKA